MIKRKLLNNKCFLSVVLAFFVVLLILIYF